MAQMIEPDQHYPARYWHLLDGGGLHCDLCPRDCTLQEGQRGACFVRARVDDRMVLTTYGRSTGFCIDPIEKKPFNHFYPGSSVFSFGTAGCNLACKCCPSWDIAKSRDMDRQLDPASPVAVARAARLHGCHSVAFTYNDPVVFLEYALATADACHDRGLKTVAVTAGYIHAVPRRELFSRMDAANVDLKAFSEDFYSKLCSGHLEPVLDTLRYIRHETSCWLEITTVLIPGYNDSAREIAALSKWVASELGAEVPLHFTAFHPDWKMIDAPPTPPATLREARQIALGEGLHYVYTGNVDDQEGETTRCPHCREALVVRDWYEILAYELTAQGGCPNCGASIAGVFGTFGRSFGQKRIPVYMRLQP